MQPVRSGPAPPKYGSGTVLPGVLVPSGPKNTPTGVGTKLAEDGEEREIDGVRYLFQRALRADVALIRARAADALGNLAYDKTARNFNPDMATAGTVVVAEVDVIVPVGEIAPDQVATPHLFVDYVVRAEVTL